MENKIKIIKRGEKEYPEQLCRLKNPPKELYCKGDLNILKSFSLAIVGARKCTDESFEYSKRLSYDLAKNDITIVSGMALGIDTSAHEGALEAAGKTIAVLGCGFNYIYPKSNRELYEKILQNGGLIISEYDEKMPPLRPNFVQRNRIVAALSSGVIVVEAGEKSGSIITAQNMKELNGKVFAVPGSVFDENFKGNNMLLKNAAILILDYKDVLKEFENITIKEVEEKEEIQIPEEYLKIYNCIKSTPQDANQISRKLNMPIAFINSELTTMEIERIYKRIARKIILG